MDYRRTIQELETVLEKSRDIELENSSNISFKVWRNLTLRTLEKIYGAGSREAEDFDSLDFSYNPQSWIIGKDYSLEDIQSFRRDFKIAIQTIKVYIEELKNELIFEKTNVQSKSSVVTPAIQKVFISHASKDKEIVEELIDLLEAVGLNHSQIFCSSFAGYGIELGENFLDRIKNELDSNVLVLFLLSENFYNSEVCLCEMGATWVKTNEHIPILIPPLDFKDIKGVIPLTQGFKITDNSSLTLFRDKITRLFDLKTMNTSVWERKRDKLVKRLNEILNSQPVKAPSRFTAIAVKRK